MDHLIEVTGYVKSYAELEKENEAKKKEEEKREGGDKKEKDQKDPDLGVEVT